MRSQTTDLARSIGLPLELYVFVAVQINYQVALHGSKNAVDPGTSVSRKLLRYTVHIIILPTRSERVNLSGGLLEADKRSGNSKRGSIQRVDNVLRLLGFQDSKLC